jgi:hypothetical protein
VISGYVLTLSREGYDKVGKFEPARYYQWSTATCVEPAGLDVNVLGPAERLTPDRGGGEKLDEPWTTAKDPLFTYGLAAVATTLRDHGKLAFGDDVPLDDRRKWTRFYQLQAAYMLACSILERVAFRIAANEGPTAAVKAFGRQAEFAVERVGVQIPQRAVYRADNPTKKATLNRPDQFANWAYQIRSNLMHRGKSTWNEADLVRTALIDLHDVLREYLLTKVPEFRMVWMESEPEYQSSCWQIKAEFAASP